MESSNRKPEAAPEPAPRPEPRRPADTPVARRAERPETARTGESVTAYDDLWFERRPIS